MRRFVGLAAVLSGFAVAPAASANGMLGHMYVSEQAIAHVETEQLRQLLLAHPDHYLNGSFLPDSGYAAGDGYGEIAHWSGFVQGYLTWIQQNYSAPYTDGEAAAHVAVLMGAASHGMTDQAFDILLYDRSVQVDGDPNELDTGTDVWLVNDRVVDYEPPVVVDADALSEVFASFNSHSVAPEVILDGMSKAKSAHAIVKQVLAPGHQRFRDQYPWAQSAYLDPKVPGSYPFNARVVAAYWEQIWRRLQGNQSVDAGLVIGVDPAPMGHPAERRVALDNESLGGFITLFMGHGMNRDSLGASSVQLLNPDGSVRPTSLRLRGDNWAGTVQLQPDAPLEPEVIYTVRVTREAQTLNGAQLAEDITFEVKSDCAPENQAACAPPDTSGGAAGAGGGSAAGAGGSPGAGAGGQPPAAGNTDGEGCAVAPNPQTPGKRGLVLAGLLLGLLWRGRRAFKH